jgi:hypothetical protein
MRKIAIIKNNPLVKKAMIYKDNDIFYLFLYDTEKDIHCSQDYIFNNLDEAEDFCKINYLLKEKDWTIINDPLPDCQHDIIDNIRIK